MKVSASRHDNDPTRFQRFYRRAAVTYIHEVVHLVGRGKIMDLVTTSGQEVMIIEYTC